MDKLMSSASMGFDDIDNDTDYDTDYMYMINYYDLSGNLIYGEYLDVGEYYVGIHGTNDILYNIRLRYIVASDEE